VIADAPLGQALAIQNRDMAPTAKRTRTALMKGGSQSATRSRAIPPTLITSRGSTTPDKPFNAASAEHAVAALSASSL
jgi:hypothetical protein